MIGKKTDQIFIRGFDYRRSDTAKISKNLQYEIFKKILYADKIEDIKQELIKYVQDTIKNFESLPLSDIAIPYGFSKDLSEYGGINKNGNKIGLDPEVRGSLYSNEYLGTNFAMGSKVKLLYITKIGKNNKQINVIPFGENTTIINVQETKDDIYPPTDVICFEEESKLPQLEVNYNKMIELTIKRKIERILGVAGISWNEIEGQQSLFDF